MLKKTILVTCLFLSQSLQCMLILSTFEVFETINCGANHLCKKTNKYLASKPEAYDNRTLELFDRNQNYLNNFKKLKESAEEQKIILPNPMNKMTFATLEANLDKLACHVAERPCKHQVHYFFGDDEKFFHECAYYLLHRKKLKINVRVP